MRIPTDLSPLVCRLFEESEGGKRRMGRHGGDDAGNDIYKQLVPWPSPGVWVGLTQPTTTITSLSSLPGIAGTAGTAWDGPSFN